MDWSSVYEENGNESGDFNRTNVVAISVRTSVLDLLQVYNPYICYAFTVNYILGVGCLGIPYAFYQSGIILGSSLIIFLSFISYTAVMWIAETSHRGMQLRLDSHSKNPFKSLKLMKWKKTSATENTGCVLNFGRMLLQPTIYETQQVLNSNGRDHGVCTGSKMGGKWSSRNSVMRAGSGLQIEKESLVKSVDNEGSLSVINLYSSISQLTFDGQQDIRKDSWGSSKHPQCIQDDSRTQSSSVRPNGLLDSSSRFLGRGRSNTADETDADCLDFSELEVTELTLEILGPQGCILYQMALAVLTYVGLLAYTQVFVQSFVSQIWPAAPAFLPNLLFGFVVIPLSCFDLAEQIIVQVVMSLLRFVALGSLFGITLMAIFQNKSSADSPGQFRNFANLVPDGSQWNGRQSAYNTPLCNLSGFGVMFTTAIFSQIFPHIVPGLIRPLAPEDKKYVPRIFFMALLTTSVVYISIGCTCVIYFKDDIKESVNLNFIGIAAHLVDTGSVFYPVLSTLAMIVVLFPALDTLSVYPLVANTLGNNLTVGFPFLKGIVSAMYQYRDNTTDNPTHSETRSQIPLQGQPRSNSNSTDHQIADNRTLKMERNERVRNTTAILWRLVAATPPVICSHYITDLSTTLQFAGLCGILLALVVPALLQKYSYQRIANIPVSLHFNPYSSHFSGNIYTDIVLGIAVFAFLISLLQMI